MLLDGFITTKPFRGFEEGKLLVEEMNWETGDVVLQEIDSSKAIHSCIAELTVALASGIICDVKIEIDG